MGEERPVAEGKGEGWTRVGGREGSFDGRLRDGVQCVSVRA